jgi:hypothetical protein
MDVSKLSAAAAFWDGVLLIRGSEDIVTASGMRAFDAQSIETVDGISRAGGAYSRVRFPRHQRTTLKPDKGEILRAPHCHPSGDPPRQRPILSGGCNRIKSSAEFNNVQWLNFGGEVERCGRFPRDRGSWRANEKHPVDRHLYARVFESAEHYRRNTIPMCAGRVKIHHRS